MHQAGQTALAQRWEGTTWLIGIQSEVSWLSAHVQEPCPSGSDSSYQQHTCMLSCSTVSDSLWPHGLQQPPGFLCPWDYPDHFLFQGIFLTQGWNLRLLRWQMDSLPFEHQGSPVTSRVGSFPLLVLWLSPRLTFSYCKFSIHIPYLCSIVTWKSFICARSWHKLAPSSTF